MSTCSAKLCKVLGWKGFYLYWEFYTFIFSPLHEELKCQLQHKVTTQSEYTDLWLVLVPHALKTTRLANSMRPRFLIMPLTGSFEGSLRCANECTVPPWWRQHRLAFEHHADTLQGIQPHVYDCVTVAKNRGLTNFCWDDFPSFRSFLNFTEIRSNYVCTEVWKTFWKPFRNLKIRYISYPLPYFSATYFLSLSFL